MRAFIIALCALAVAAFAYGLYIAAEDGRESYRREAQYKTACMRAGFLPADCDYLWKYEGRFQ
jgi:hypothetical protein